MSKRKSQRVVLHFPRRLVDQPIVSRMVKECDLDFNILKANITPRAEGLLVLELSGEEKDFQNAMEYLKKSGVTIQPLSQDVVRNEERCTHCGACVTLCPSGALYVDPVSRKVIFSSDKCIACEICVPACPLGAMEVHF